MSTPYDQLHKLNSISRWNNEIRTYNSLHAVLKDSAPQRDPFFGERYPQSDPSATFEPSPTTVNEDCSIYQKRYANGESENLRNDVPNYLLKTVLNNNKKNLSPDAKQGAAYIWNSSIDQHHTYFPCHETRGDPCEASEYLAAQRTVHRSSSPVSADEPSLHDDGVAIPALRTPHREFPNTSASSLSPIAETMTYFVADRNKGDALETSSPLEDLGKERSERPKRRKNNKQDADEKICGICGDNAKSLHFGGMTCDSCKAFFRRSVQTKSCQSFRCSLEENCQITKKNRKCCQYCRFQKCLSIGMEIRWVMPEAERMELWKSKLARHREVKAVSQAVTVYMPLSPLPTTAATSLSEKDQQSIKELTLLQEIIFSSSAYPSVCNNAEELSAVFFCICQKLQKFFFRTEQFQQLISDDQGRMMKCGIAMSIYIHGAYLYDVENNTWPSADNKPYLRSPVITNSLLKVFTVFTEIYEALMSFYRAYANDIKDESVLALLCLISLFFEPSPEVKFKAQVIQNRDYFINLLKNYLADKLGAVVGDEKFAHLMGCYVHTKRIISYHNKVSIEPTFRPQKLANWNSASFDMQMNSLIQGLRQSRVAGLPKFASVFGGDSSTVGDRRLRTVDKREETYAWLTSVLFGCDTKADTLRAYFKPDILTEKTPARFMSQLE